MSHYGRESANVGRTPSPLVREQEDTIAEFDAYDAILHHIFKQTQGEAWIRQLGESVQVGVAIRADSDPPTFRVFPYDSPRLVSFEAAVRGLNPLVAVKLRSAAIHAAMSTTGAQDQSMAVDVNNRVQILGTVSELPRADKEQCAAFIRDEMCLIVWSTDLDKIIPACQELEHQLVQLSWSKRMAFLPASSSIASMSTGLSPSRTLTPYGSTSEIALKGNRGAVEKAIDGDFDEHALKTEKANARSSWFGWKSSKDVETSRAVARPTRLLAPIYNGFGAALCIVCIAMGGSVLLPEYLLDGNALRFLLLLTVPFLFCISLYFFASVIGTFTQIFGPVTQYHQNSKYYSAVKPSGNPAVDNNLPHITIQMPVYKESLKETIAPSCASLKKAIQTYARQGGTSSIMICDDGMQLIDEEKAKERQAYYAEHGIGWVARPGHSNSPDGFKRAGRFKKASNMNYAIKVSLKLEKHLAMLMQDEQAVLQHRAASRLHALSEAYAGHQLDNDDEEALEDIALRLAMDEVYEESGNRFKAMGANGRALRMGEVILIVDSDTIVPEDCLRDAAREMAESPEVGVIQHESDVMQVAHNYFENGIAHFTRRINHAISFACANGEVAAFVGHNAFLRWSAIQDVAFIDPADNERKIWSENNVSEDFDMALRLQLGGYIVRWATYSEGGFKEGVSLTADDELNRWEKYAFGCSELIFNPLVEWFTKGPITAQLHTFIWSAAPVHYKLSMLAYMFSYYGIAASFPLTLANYFMLGWQLPIDAYYLSSFNVWFSIVVVFPLCGNLSYAVLEYRLGHAGFFKTLIENVMWVPFFFIFFGGLSIHLGKAMLAHMVSYNIQWGATKKEVERSNFFLEVPKIISRFRVALVLCILVVAAMILLTLPVIPREWQISGGVWGVTLPMGIVLASHVTFPILLNPYLMVFSY